MPRRYRFSLFPIVLAAFITVISWPVFVACATAIGYFMGESWQLEAWHQEPRLHLLNYFSEGWIASAPIAVGIGILAAIDWLLFARKRLLSFFAGVLLPLAGASAALLLWHDPMELLPTLACTGVALAIAYRMAEFARRVTD